jgi:multicomponent Na+:H+ antiporter subunit G
MRTILAAFLLSAGVAFITIAALGVARLPDVFQRMHAATKAGGIGTTLVIIGVLTAGDIVRPSTALLTIAFMLLTLSVASQLLARASYISATTTLQLEGRDALEGVLDRQEGSRSGG